jgi:hypothetical protein
MIFHSFYCICISLVVGRPFWAAAIIIAACLIWNCTGSVGGYHWVVTTAAAVIGISFALEVLITATGTMMIAITVTMVTEITMMRITMAVAR